MADKDKKDNAPTDDLVPTSAKPKKAAPPQEDPQDDDEEQKEVERRQRQEKVKKRKEELRKKAEQKRKQEQEEDDEIEEDPTPSKTPKSKAAAAPKQEIRENVVNNSVMFLNHPKVKSAPMSQKIAYLQKKGLTQEEIQETIERAGESMPASNTGFSQSAQPSQSYNNPAIPPRPTNYYGPQSPQYPPQQYPQQQLIPAPPQQQSWYGGKVGLAITVASCIGIGMGFSYIAKNYISPWLFNREKDTETKQREEYQTKVFEEMLQSLKSMQQSNTELKDYMKTQGELKDLVKTALDRPAASATPQSATRDLERMKIAELESELKKMKAQMVDAKSLQTAASTSSYQTWNPTESKIPAWQRNVLSSSTPSVNTTPSNTDSFKSPSKDTTPASPQSPPSDSSADPVPSSYAQILNMVKNGQLPDDIKDIDDKPREPFTPIEKGERESRPKPWQKGKSATPEPAPASPSTTPSSPSTAPANTEHTNGHVQTETKPASTESSPAEQVVS